MSYTIKLVGLECFRAEEVDGDQVYVKLNGAKVWEAHPDRMKHVPVHEHHVSEFDFAGGRKHTRDGWVPLMPYNPDAFVFPDQAGSAALEVRDALDLLGDAPVDSSQASGGNISVVFRRAGAHYRLTYKVEAP